MTTERGLSVATKEKGNMNREASKLGIEKGWRVEVCGVGGLQIPRLALLWELGV